MQSDKAGNKDSVIFRMLNFANIFSLGIYNLLKVS